MKTNRSMQITLFTLLALFAAGFTSCDDPNGDGTNPADDGPVEFPALSIMPKEDVYKQKKSAKRGVSTNFVVADMPALMGSGISWCYNWSHSPLTDARWQALKDNGMTFYPMVWNGGVNANSLKTFSAADPNCEYVLGYNEPNLADQAEMTPTEAANAWGAYLSAAAGAGLKTVSPAMCYGTMNGYHDPVVWLDDFLAKDGVSLDDMEAVAVHAYMPSGEAVKSFIRKFKKYGKPIWLTEFAHSNATISPAASQYQFMAEMLNYLEADPAVEKYAWFMDTHKTAAGGYWELIDRKDPSSPKLSDLGRLYISISSLDKTTFYNVDENIPAEHYSGHSAEAAAAGDEWVSGVLPRITTDFLGTLEIYNFVAGTWIEYCVDVPRDGKYRFDIRYATPRDTQIVLSAQGVADKVIAIPKTGAFDTWTTMGEEIDLKAGKQTIRISNQKGTACFNWFRVTSPLK